MSAPKMRTVPPSGRFRPMMVLSSTDLPAPEPPTTPTTSPRWTVRLEAVMDDVVAERRAQIAHLDRRRVVVELVGVELRAHMFSFM